MPPDPATDGRWRWSLIVLAGLVPFASDMMRNFQLFAPRQLAGSFAVVLGGTTVIYGLCALAVAVLGRRCPALRRRAGAVFAAAAALVFAAFLCDANLSELRQAFGWPRPAALGAVLALFVLYWALAARLGARKTSLLLLALLAFRAGQAGWAVASSARRGDVTNEGGQFEVLTPPNAYNEVSEKLTAAGYNVSEDSGVNFVPTVWAPVTDKAQAASLLKLVEAIEELEDVQYVYMNGDIADEAIEG